MSNSFYTQLQQVATENGPFAASKLLVEELRRQGRYQELFEALKMHHRLELGLPAVHIDAEGTGDQSGLLESSTQELLDKKLIESCEEVGSALLRKGALQEGWMYMRAVGDRKAAAEALATIEPTHENLDMLLALLVQEGVDVKRGAELSLKMRGTCNTITMMDSVVAMRGRFDQQQAVGALVEHVHRELLNSLLSDLARREDWSANHPERSIKSIAKLLESRPDLLKDGSYHLDTTHLASTVRFARVLDNPDQIRLALDMAHYGKKLHAQYQFASDEPFADLYPMSIAWFKAILGEQVDAALLVFLQKAEGLDPNQHGTVAIETYVDLLTRTERSDEAMRFLIKKMPRGMRPFGIAPSLIELATFSGNYQLMMDHASERRDDIGFAAALLQQESNRQKSNP